MHLRFSTCLGTSVVEEGTGETLGVIAGILIDPDTGKVEGFYVRVPGILHAEDHFLATLDVLRWGTAVTVRSQDALSSAEDRIRLLPLLNDRRRVLGQRIRTEGVRRLGRCRDVQFESKTWQIEWIFPRMFLRWGIPVAAPDIIEIRADAIVVRDPAGTVPVVEAVEAAIAKTVSEVTV